jgi:hypothetical protein
MKEYKETFTKTVKDENGLRHILSSVRDVHSASHGWYVGVADITVMSNGDIKVDIPLIRSESIGIYKEVFVKFVNNKQSVDYVLNEAKQTYKGSDGWSIDNPLLNNLPSGNTLVQIPLKRQKAFIDNNKER